MYTAIEIITVFRRCISIDEVMHACKCFSCIIKDGDQKNIELINKASLLKIKELS